MYADADTPSKAIGEAFARAGSGASPAPAASQGPAAPAEAEAGTYAATATPFQGGSHSILAPTPSISGDPPAAMGSAPDQAPAASQASAALHSTQDEQQVQLQALLCACSLLYAVYHKSTKHVNILQLNIFVSPAAADPRNKPILNSCLEWHRHAAQVAAESWPSVAELEQEGVSQLLASEAAGQLQQQYTFLYAHAPDLRMDDVPVLLRQYKELILKHEALVCAVQARRAKQQSGTGATQTAPTAGTAVLHAADRLFTLHGSEQQASSIMLSVRHVCSIAQ